MPNWRGQVFTHTRACVREVRRGGKWGLEKKKHRGIKLSGVGSSLLRREGRMGVRLLSDGDRSGEGRRPGLQGRNRNIIKIHINSNQQRSNDSRRWEDTGKGPSRKRNNCPSNGNLKRKKGSNGANERILGTSKGELGYSGSFKDSQCRGIRKKGSKEDGPRAAGQRGVEKTQVQSKLRT